MWLCLTTMSLNLCLCDFSGTATNTCPARHTSTGPPGRRGNAALCLVAAASSHAGEPVRTATTVPGVVRYVMQNNASHMHRSNTRLFSVAVHCLGAQLKPFDATKRQW